MRACYSCPQRGSCEPRRRHGDDGIGDPPQPLDQRARALSVVRGTRRLAEHLQDVVADALPIVEHRHLAGVRGSECAPSTTSASPGGGPCGNRSRAVISGRKTLVVRIPYGVLTPIGHQRHLGDVAELGENADRRQTGERRTGDQTTSMSPARPGPALGLGLGVISRRPGDLVHLRPRERLREVVVGVGPAQPVKFRKSRVPVTAPTTASVPAAIASVVSATIASVGDSGPQADKTATRATAAIVRHVRRERPCSGSPLGDDDKSAAGRSKALRVGDPLARSPWEN